MVHELPFLNVIILNVFYTLMLSLHFIGLDSSFEASVVNSIDRLPVQIKFNRAEVSVMLLILTFVTL